MDNLNVKTFSECIEQGVIPEILFWVGCAGSFDERAKKITKAFVKILNKAKELESKMKESQKKIKEIRVEGVSGSNSVKVILDGEGDMQKIEISNEILKEEKSIVEDLIVAAHNNAKSQLKTKTSEEISKATGGLGIPGFKWPL